MGNVVLVVDMLRGFLEPGYNLYCGDEASKIIPNVQRLLQHENQAGSQVLFVCDNHDPDDLEFQMFPKHCVKGTREAEVILSSPGLCSPTTVFLRTGTAASLTPTWMSVSGVLTRRR